ncbi:hypothetical protein PG993_005343 [Apiospora rasikravindrae]|uniref:G-patch domain-containing protein n=1 Tax=Apiospora rasikravindrae TaxID=990691 RepID=A0ABR1THU1_9PEZI
MSTKRPRATFEADLQNQQSPYVHFGTPLPPLDREARDDGSYVPVWKQEVRDERGRKRLHGAFTGGFSAGYFNTVGSKEGWTPSAFVSSRTNRHNKDNKDGAAPDGGGAAKPQQQRPEDFMDEEDLADQAEAQKLQTAAGFAGLGSTEQDSAMRRGGGFADLFRSSGETMGIKLLKRMGWKEGQGIGPKVRRKARLDVGANKNGAPRADDGATETYLFAPENVRMIAFVKKLDRKGLGYAGEAKLAPMATAVTKKGPSAGSSDEEDEDGPLIRPRIGKKKPKPSRGGIGIGILNDTGSDDEDPYEIGPRISYNRVIGGDKKKKKKATTAVNPSLRSAPVLITRKDALSKAGKNLRKCHDGRLPLAGFSFGTDTDTLTSMINSDVKYPPPKIPEGWKSAKKPKGSDAANNGASYLSTADAAKASKLDPQARAALLGEAQLPGKSVFDFLSADARQRLAAASGKTNLPPALGEIPAGYAMTPEEKQRELASQVPALEKETAIAALTRSAAGGTGGGNTPYADDDAKRGRYRAYLGHAAGYSKAAALPAKPPGQRPEDYLRELREFHSVARIFRPMSGMMASRFTTSTSSSSTSSKFTTGSSAETSGTTDLLSKPVKSKAPADPAEEAAGLGMFGAMTRSTADFYPTRLLCKRFNVRPPAHVQPDGGNSEPKAEQPQQSAFETAMYGSSGVGGGSGSSRMPPSMDPITPSHSTPTSTAAAAASGAGTAMTLDELLRQAQQPPQQGEPSRDVEMTTTTAEPEGTEVDASVNEALEGKRAQDEVLKAIFGDDSDEDEDD